MVDKKRKKRKEKNNAWQEATDKEILVDFSGIHIL